GGWSRAAAFSPAAGSRAITSDQHDPSANSPWTRTTFRAVGPVSVRAQRGVSAAAAPVAIAIANKRRSTGESLLQPIDIDAASDYREALRAARQPENSTQRIAAA